MFATTLSQYVSCQRGGGSRYVPLDRTLWKVSIADEPIKSEWLNNISPLGLQFRFPKQAAYNIGDVVPIKVCLQGSTLIKTAGMVRWKKDDPFSYDMCVLGVAFVDPQKEIIGIWKQKELERLVAPVRKDRLYAIQGSHGRTRPSSPRKRIDKALVTAGAALLALAAVSLLLR